MTSEKTKTSNAGRPTKLTPALRKAIIKHIRAGNYVESSAKACGVPPRTLYRWLQVGRGEHPTLPATEPYKTFAEDIEVALAEAEIESVEVVRSSDDWRAAMAYLQTGPSRERFSPAVTVNAQIAPGVALLDNLRQRRLSKKDDELEPLEVSFKELKQPETAELAEHKEEY